ncbi:hypothetical protein CGLO_10100 [Colletotrichum gloeosporioides Cg-14]|uniref:Uncharacterized protein n=1 Tax=Colletotrichum gloeosporioides (strain Cg-14) TaxID=1237896 RepID=T0K4S8_COLGC|nr:hypothetical protein CGLO_10100 [Colletotrichum gloeosporioides Cg-14]
MSFRVRNPDPSTSACGPELETASSSTTQGTSAITYSQGSNLTTHTHRSLRPASGLVRARREVFVQPAANGPMPTSPVSLVGIKWAPRESPAEVENAEGCN